MNHMRRSPIAAGGQRYWEIPGVNIKREAWSGLETKALM